MPNLRELFHTIANWHNKITLAAGCTKEILKDKPLDTLTKDELKALQEKLIPLLDKIESDAVNVNQQVMALKEILAKKIDISREDK